MPDLIPLVQPALNVGTTQHVAYTGTAAAISNAVASSAVLVVTTSDAHISIGDAPVAVAASDLFVPAKTPMTFACQPTNKISAVQDSAGGTLFVTSLN